MAYWELSSGKFTEIWDRMSPNTSGFMPFLPKYLVMHFTAGRSGTRSRNWLTRRDSRVSAHFVVDRSGQSWQIVPCDVVAWHAGRSRWDGITGLNRHSIGIEIDNMGRLSIESNGTYKAWFGDTVPAAEVLVARHKHGGAQAGWHTFPEAQLRAVDVLTQQILHWYPSVKQIVGHDDIAPGRKTDPGPAFPMRRYQQMMAGRFAGQIVGEALCGEEFLRVHRQVNCRTGPSTAFHRLSFSPLQARTVLKSTRTEGAWRYVEVVGRPRHEGWVHGDYLRPDESRSTSGPLAGTGICG